MPGQGGFVVATLPLPDTEHAANRTPLIAAIGSAVLTVASFLALGVAPTDQAGGQEIVAWFTVNGGPVRLFSWLLTAFIPVFATFAAVVRSRLPAPHRDVFLLGAAGFLAQTAVSLWFWAGLSWHPGQVDPATARTLLDLVSFWGPILNGATISMLAPVVVLSWGRRAILPRWLGVVGAIALAEQAVESVLTIFGQSGFVAPGGPMNLMLGAGLVTIWVVCLGVALTKLPVHRGPETG
jgi:hypothetical protein